MNVPTGTITFLFTDIEGSTKLWERCPEAMRLALARHDELLRTAIVQHNGYVFKTVGDAFCAAFSTALDAVDAALDAHLSLLKETWGETGSIRVRMGIHTGEAEQRDNDYFGPTLNRAARLQAIAYGGQTLLSQVTYELVRDRLRERATIQPLGLHRLKDLNRPEQVYQLNYPDLPSEFPELRSLESLPNNLPIQRTSFIGREREMEEVKRLVDSCSLVTLLGSGGAGKTRLSLQAGADLLERYPDGVWFVELAPLSDPALLAQTVSSALGVKQEAGRNADQTLIASLKSKSLLLILDNCEHLVAACARLAQSLLQNCPYVHILASSREAFHIPGETVYRVPTLRLPDPKETFTVETLSQYEAVRLFIDRAVSIQSGFAVTNQNVPALAALCARLDGLPLAIELAAARVRSLSVEEINSRLDNCFRLLTGGSRTALPRQQTLRALIDWSYDLLSEPEKALLRRLSVFSGGWTLEAAEAVCAGEAVEDWEILDFLTSLTDKSLVAADHSNEHMRFRLLETIRQYAADRLSESGETDPTKERHLDYFLSVAEKTSEMLSGAEEQTGLDLLLLEHDNLRAAFDQARAERPETALNMAARLGQFWHLGGFLAEGRAALEVTLASFPSEAGTAIHGKAYFQAGRLAEEQGDLEPARRLLERSVEICRSTGNKRDLASALSSLGVIAYRQNLIETARLLFEEGLAIHRETGNDVGIGASLNNLGSLAELQRDLKVARHYYNESLAIYRKAGRKRGVATALYNIGLTYVDEGDRLHARSFFDQSLAIAQELHDDWYAAYAQYCLAEIEKSEANYGLAGTIAHKALRSLRKVGDRRMVASTLVLLGQIACLEKDADAGLLLLSESLDLSQKAGQTDAMLNALECFARLASVAGESDATQSRFQALRAAKLLGAAQAHRLSLEQSIDPHEETEHAAFIQSIRARIEPEAFETAWSEGEALPLEGAIEYARHPEYP